MSGRKTGYSLLNEREKKKKKKKKKQQQKTKQTGCHFWRHVYICACEKKHSAFCSEHYFFYDCNLNIQSFVYLENLFSIKLASTETCKFSKCNVCISAIQYPAGTWRKYNVATTSMQRHDVASTLRRRYIYVMCPLGSFIYRHIQPFFLYRNKSYIFPIFRVSKNWALELYCLLQNNRTSVAQITYPGFLPISKCLSFRC